MRTNHAAAAVFLWIPGRTMMSAKVQNGAVTGFHGRARNLEPVRFSIPIRRVRISLVPHTFVRKKINAFIVVFKLMRAQCEPQRSLFRHII